MNKAAATGTSGQNQPMSSPPHSGMDASCQPQGVSLVLSGD
jgi:hypothetical protein